jgi:glutathione S-transferase
MPERQIVDERITLFQSDGRQWGMPNLSPFCIKLETYLRLANWSYDTQPANFRKAPKGKVPYVALNGQLLGDSQLIIEALEARRPPERRLDHTLSKPQRATGHALRRMLEEGLYFVLVHWRWVDAAGWKIYRPGIGSIMGPIRHILPLIRRGVVKANKSQGTGRHSPAEIARLGIADLTALAEHIGEQRWLFGEQCSTFDASVFAFIEGIAGFPAASPVRDFLLAESRLMGYRSRVRAAIWRDLAASQ